MKNITNSLYMLLASVILISCSLDENIYTEVEKKNYMQDATEAQTVLLGTYRSMVEEGMYRYHLSLLFSIPSDIAKVTGNTIDNFRNIPSNAYTSAQTEVQQTWQSLYRAVYKANDFIEQLSLKYNNYSDGDKTRAAVYMAEARALRGLYYFELVRWFGNVALFKNTAQSSQHPSTFVQEKPEVIYGFIEPDLLFVIDHLPYAVHDDVRVDKRFRFSNGASQGLLAKVYATWAGYPLNDSSKWEKSAQVAKALIQSGKHQLLNDYEQLWKNTCNGVWDPRESLIEVSFYSPTITGRPSEDPSGRIGKWNGVSANGIRSVRNAGNWRVVPTFLRDWKDRSQDRRWSISFADYKYGYDKDSNKNGVLIPLSKNGKFEDAIQEGAKADLKKVYVENMCPAKWDTEKYVGDTNYLIDANMSNINWYVLRYADVLLLYAEALNEINNQPTNEAFEAINSVRRRAFGFPTNVVNATSDLSSTMDYTEFKKAIMDERAYELSFEGQRRQDLVRWGIYVESIKNTAQNLVNWYSEGAEYYQAVNYTQKNKHELLPIPQRDLDLMKQFKQNPGW
mgnify:CR=1 FL=1